MSRAVTEGEPAPVFVDQTGRRGRRFRGFGWVTGAVFVGFAGAMISGLAGTQSQAPVFAVPDAADTTPPSQFVNAPLPSAPRGTGSAAVTPEATASTATTSTAVPRATATTSAVTPGTAAVSTSAATARTPVVSTSAVTPSTPVVSTSAATTGTPVVSTSAP